MTRRFEFSDNEENEIVNENEQPTKTYEPTIAENTVVYENGLNENLESQENDQEGKKESGIKKKAELMPPQYSRGEERQIDLRRPIMRQCLPMRR